MPGFKYFFAWFVMAGFSLASLTAAENHLEFFEKQVRPVLVERCYECHAEKKQKGGLRLDTRSHTLKGGDNGPVVVPGKPEDSLLIKAISYSDPDLQMPPKNRLSPQEAAVLTEWIKMGAPDPRTDTAIAAASARSLEEGKKWWAYQSVKNPVLPSVKNPMPGEKAIDRFIVSKLEPLSIPLAPEADKTILVRRLYFDLIGLPPTPEEIGHFIQDSSTNSYATLVDQLLASPHFGERWGRHWLDVARFGESVTLRGLVFKEAWRYRDYVIDVFNHDLPFDQFIREQLAGDLLPASNLKARQRQRVATTFLALGNSNLEEQDKAQLRMDIVDEQLDTIGKAFLAQTIGCARCHDHKFDPIPTRDYYAMAGILRNTKTVVDANVSNWIDLPLPLEPDQEQRFRQLEISLTNLQAKLKAAKEDAAKLVAASSSPVAGVLALTNLPGILIDDEKARAVGTWKHSQFSGTYIAKGYLHDLNEDKGAKTLTFQPELLKAGVYEIRLAYLAGANRASAVPVTILSAEGETTVTVNQQKVAPIEGRFVSLGQYRFEQNGQGFVLISNQGTDGHVVADAVQFLPIEALEPGQAPSGKSPTVLKEITLKSKPANPEVKEIEAEIKQLNANLSSRPMVMSVKEEATIGDTYVHLRGSVHNRGENVPRGFLQVANWRANAMISEKQSGRRELAEWIASAENPLTSRVIANRVWHWLFGSGLVRTTDNFGTTGEKPSHPELLDYLANRLVVEGWSIKKLVREIVLSRTYRQESFAAEAALKIDPENRWFSRMNRRRLEAECIRDAMLVASGQLKRQVGGSTIDRQLSADFGFKYQETRRTLYAPVFRNALPELMEVFDGADPSVVTGARNHSTVAPQALFLMNHPFVIEQSNHAANSLLKRPGLDLEQRIVLAFRLTLGRLPTEGEKSLALEFVGVPSKPAEPELERWTEFFQSLFSSLDFRYLN